MMAHPEVLAKAQNEIDVVVGSDRLPTPQDRPSLPYGLFFASFIAASSHLRLITVEAIMNETYRWGAPVPLSEQVFSITAY
jgi:hypothetical protein